MTNRNTAIVWVLAVFLIGALSGGGMVYLFTAPRANQADESGARPPRGRTGREDPERMIENLSGDLQLSADQKVKMRQIFEESRRNFHEAFKNLREQTHRELEQVLRPEQMKKFDEIMKQREQERERNRREKPPAR